MRQDAASGWKWERRQPAPNNGGETPAQEGTPARTCPTAAPVGRPGRVSGEPRSGRADPQVGAGEGLGGDLVLSLETRAHPVLGDILSSDVLFGIFPLFLREGAISPLFPSFLFFIHFIRKYPFGRMQSIVS